MDSDEKLVPTRRNGTPKAYWYDRDWPGHIMHRKTDGSIRAICIGHRE